MGKGHLAFWLPKPSPATPPLRPAPPDALRPSFTTASVQQLEARTPKAEPRRHFQLGRGGGRAPAGLAGTGAVGPRRARKGAAAPAGTGAQRRPLHSRGASLSRTPSPPGTSSRAAERRLPGPYSPGPPNFPVLSSARLGCGERAWRPAPSACPGRRRATWPFPGGGVVRGRGQGAGLAAPTRPGRSFPAPSRPDSPFPRGPHSGRRCGGSC